MNENLPGLPGLPRVIPRSTRSVASFLMNRGNKYRQKAPHDYLETQRKISHANIKKTKAETGYTPVLGKLSA